MVMDLKKELGKLKDKLNKDIEALGKSFDTKRQKYEQLIREEAELSKNLEVTLVQKYEKDFEALIEKANKILLK